MVYEMIFKLKLNFKRLILVDITKVLITENRDNNKLYLIRNKRVYNNRMKTIHS